MKAGKDAPDVILGEPAKRARISQLEITVDDEVGGRDPADRNQVDGQAVEVQNPGGAHQADRHDRVSGPGGTGNVLATRVQPSPTEWVQGPIESRRR